MTRRSPLVRFFTLAWATLQLVAPAMTSIADGRLANESASAPRTHVEATSTERCPQVHAPDCGLCRYVNTSSASDAEAPAFDWAADAAVPLLRTASLQPRGAIVALPFGRAPPTV